MGRTADPAAPRLHHHLGAFPSNCRGHHRAQISLALTACARRPDTHLASSAAMTKTRTVPRVRRLRHAAPEVDGAVLRLRRLEHPRRRDRGGRAVAGRLPRDRRARDPDDAGRGRESMTPSASHRDGRARPRPRRWARAGVGRPRRRRPGHREVDVAPPAAAAWTRPEPGVVRERRGVARQIQLRAERLGAVRGDYGWPPRRRCPACSAASTASSRCRRRRLHPDHRRPDLASAPARSPQVRECAHRLVREAKRRGVAVVLVGHVTKDGALAGPRVLEHVVDTVLSFEGERHQRCACCGPSSTGSDRPTSSACSR